MSKAASEHFGVRKDRPGYVEFWRGIERANRTKEARGFLGAAASRVGDEAVVDIVLPVIERVMRGDVDIVDLKATEGAGLVKAMRSKGMAYRLRKIGVHMDLVPYALRFARDFEKARIGGLTANLDGYGGGAKRSGEPERWCEAIDLLSKACARLDARERVVVFGYLLFDVSAGDLGSFVGGHLSSDKNMHMFTGKLYLDNALNKLALFYDDHDHVQERHRNEAKTG